MDESLSPSTPTDHHIHRRSVPDLLGEALREAGVLLFVFIPLDLALQGHGLTLGWFTAIVVPPAAFVISGIYVERTRKQ